MMDVTPEGLRVRLLLENSGVDGAASCGDGISCKSMPNCNSCPMKEQTTGNGLYADLRQLRDAHEDLTAPTEGVYTGGSSSYYTLKVENTTTPNGTPYTAECNDIIEALGMNFAEGNAFKALWRRAAQRTLGLRKAGAKDDGLYDAEKVEFFGARLVAQSKAVKNDSE